MFPGQTGQSRGGELRGASCRRGLLIGRVAVRVRHMQPKAATRWWRSAPVAPDFDAPDPARKGRNEGRRGPLSAQLPSTRTTDRPQRCAPSLRLTPPSALAARSSMAGGSVLQRGAARTVGGHSNTPYIGTPYCSESRQAAAGSSLAMGHKRPTPRPTRDLLAVRFACRQPQRRELRILGYNEIAGPV